VDLKNLTDKAKELIDKRGGTGSLKEDADELKEIASSDESLADKAKDVVEAIKDPGDDDATAVPAPTDAPEEPAAVEPEARPGKRRGQQRGKGGRHGQGHGGGGQDPRGRGGRGRRGGRDGDPAV